MSRPVISAKVIDRNAARGNLVVDVAHQAAHPTVAGAGNIVRDQNAQRPRRRCKPPSGY
jgi:hypothetical protein